MVTAPGQSEKTPILAEMIRDIRVAMLTTVTGDGRLRSRPMATQEIGADGLIYFLTRSDAGKADEIRHNDHVNVTYVDAAGNRFVSLTGVAAVSQDRAKIAELWKPSCKTWFPQGLDDSEIAVLAVQVDQAEYWDALQSTMVEFIHPETVAAASPATPFDIHSTNRFEFEGDAV